MSNIDDVLKNPCSFCRKSEFCNDKVMVKGLNKLISEVAPGLKLECENKDFSLSNTPKWMCAAAVGVTM